MCNVKNPFGDGRAADRIVNILLQSLASGQPHAVHCVADVTLQAAL
jgi:UDP-N-acetylglucosamine 2-epimerase